MHNHLSDRIRHSACGPYVEAGEGLDFNNNEKTAETVVQSPRPLNDVAGMSDPSRPDQTG